MASHVGVGAQALGPTYAAFLGMLAESWITSGEEELEPSPI